MIEHRIKYIKILALQRKLQDQYWQWEGHSQLYKSLTIKTLG